MHAFNMKDVMLCACNSCYCGRRLVYIVLLVYMYTQTQSTFCRALYSESDTNGTVHVYVTGRSHGSHHSVS